METSSSFGGFSNGALARADFKALESSAAWPLLFFTLRESTLMSPDFATVNAIVETPSIPCFLTSSGYARLFRKSFASLARHVLILSDSCSAAPMVCCFCCFSAFPDPEAPRRKGLIEKTPPWYRLTSPVSELFHGVTLFMDLLEITGRLVEDLRFLRFSAPVAYVYNPLVYAREPHVRYLTRYGGGGREAVFVGMNPGPWGMAQTGVPFGEIDLVQNWLGIDGDVGKPCPEHPKKLVEGFRCRRSEVSGRRLWGLFRERCGTPERFFGRFFVVNYCPLLFLDADGRNLTPDKLKSGERAPMLQACDSALLRCIEHIGPTRVIGVGNFAEERAREILKGSGVKVGKILHPSPANPAANSNWKEIVLAQLRDQGIEF